MAKQKGITLKRQINVKSYEVFFDVIFCFLKDLLWFKELNVHQYLIRNSLHSLSLISECNMYSHKSSPANDPVHSNDVATTLCVW